MVLCVVEGNQSFYMRRVRSLNIWFHQLVRCLICTEFPRIKSRHHCRQKPYRWLYHLSLVFSWTAGTLISSLASSGSFYLLKLTLHFPFYHTFSGILQLFSGSFLVFSGIFSKLFRIF